MKIRSILFSMILLASLTACLKTRAQLNGQDNTLNPQQGAIEQPEQGRYVSGTVNPQQRAQIDSRFYEIDRDFRQLYGKVENMENQLNQLNSIPTTGAAVTVDDAKVRELEKRIATLEEAIVALDKKVGSSKGAKKVTQKPKGFFALGKDLMAKKEYEKAILMFEKYRTKYPRGKKYAQATYEIARCFERLKLPGDAKAFYQEIIDRYPKTKMSARAQSQLKKIL